MVKRSGDRNQTKRDNFSSKVKRFLAAEAGNKCSLTTCEKLTSGPGAGEGLVINDGRAAHITAAASGGPRYDHSLSREQRVSAENGIWTCTQHASEIDSLASTYSVEALRGLKAIRKARAREEFRRGGSSEESSNLLIEFPYVVTSEKLVDIIRPQAYSYQNALTLHDLLVDSPFRERILELIPEVIIHTWDCHPDIAGLLATLLCNIIELWHPSSSVMTKLDELCGKALRADDWTRVASVEPLGFALAAQGRSETQKRVLERIVSPSHWRERDIARVKKYYGGVGVELGAIMSHWRDPLRKGLLQANDVGRLMDVILSNDKHLEKSAGRNGLLNLLLEHAKVLSACGAPEAGRNVIDFVEGLRLAHKRS